MSLEKQIILMLNIAYITFPGNNGRFCSFILLMNY